MNELDLHGTKHQDVQQKVDSFLYENYENMPVSIITGNSHEMKRIVISIINEYEYNYREGFINKGVIEVY